MVSRASRSIAFCSRVSSLDRGPPAAGGRPPGEFAVPFLCVLMTMAVYPVDARPVALVLEAA